jgi:hypothetical protein
MDTYNKIAYLKVVRKQIDKEIEQLEKNLRAKERIVPLGKFIRVAPTIMDIDKKKFLKVVGKDFFINASKFTSTSIKETLPSELINKLNEKKIISFYKGSEGLRFYVDKTIQLPKIEITVTGNESEFVYNINP